MLTLLFFLIMTLASSNNENQNIFYLVIKTLYSLSSLKNTDYLLNRENQLIELGSLYELNPILEAIENISTKTFTYTQANTNEFDDIFELSITPNIDNFKDNFQKIFYSALIYINVESSKQIYIHESKKEYVLYLLIYTIKCYFHISQILNCNSEINYLLSNLKEFFVKSKYVLCIILSTCIDNSEIFQDLKRIIEEKKYSIKKYLNYINYNHIKKNLNLQDEDEKNIKKASIVFKSNNFFEIKEFKILLKLIAIRLFFNFRNIEDNVSALNYSSLVTESNLGVLNQYKQSYAVFENDVDKIIYVQSRPGVLQIFKFYNEILAKYTCLFPKFKLHFQFNLNFNDQINEGLNCIFLDFLKQKNHDEISLDVMVQKIKFFLIIPSLPYLKILDADESKGRNPIFNFYFNVNKQTKYDITTKLIRVLENVDSLDIILHFEKLVRQLIYSYFNLTLFNVHFYDINNQKDKIKKFLYIDMVIKKQNENNDTITKNDNSNPVQNVLKLFKSDFNAKITKIKLFFKGLIVFQQLKKLKYENTHLYLLNRYISYNYHSSRKPLIIKEINRSNIYKRKIDPNVEPKELRKKINKTNKNCLA